MVERYTGGPLPAAHPVPGGPPPIPDGLGVPQPSLPPRELRRARLLFALAGVVMAAGIIIGALQ